MVLHSYIVDLIMFFSAPMQAHFIKPSSSSLKLCCLAVFLFLFFVWILFIEEGLFQENCQCVDAVSVASIKNWQSLWTREKKKYISGAKSVGSKEKSQTKKTGKIWCFKLFGSF